MLVFENTFISLEIFESHYLMTWTNLDKKMSDEDYRTAMLAHLKVVLEYKPTRILVDIRELNFSILPETQKWSDEKILSKTYEAGLHRDAFLVSKDLVSQFSAEQTMSQRAGSNKNIMYFSERQKALKWLMSDE